MKILRKNSKKKTKSKKDDEATARSVRRTILNHEKEKDKITELKEYLDQTEIS